MTIDIGTVEISWKTDHIIVALGPTGDDGTTVFSAAQVVAWSFQDAQREAPMLRPELARTKVFLTGGQTLTFAGPGAWKIDEAMTTWTWRHPGPDAEPKVQSVD